MVADHDLNVNWALWAHCVAITPICKSSGERIWTSEAHRHRIMKPARYQASDTPQIIKELKWLERWVLPPLKLAYETCFFAESAPIEMVAEA